MKSICTRRGSQLLVVVAFMAVVIGSSGGGLGGPSSFVRIAYNGGTVYAGLRKSGIAALDVQGRELLWTFNDSDAPGFSEPVFNGNRMVVLVPAGEGSSLISLDPSSGKVDWHRSLPEVDRRSAPSLCGGRLLVNNHRTGEEAGLDPETGLEIWNTAGSGLRLMNPPVVDSKWAWFVGTHSDENAPSLLLKMDCSDGSVKKSFPIPHGNYSLHPLVLHRGVAILSMDRIETQPGRIMAIDLQRGELSWSAPFLHRMDYAPVVSEGQLIGSVWSMDLTTGKLLFDYSPFPGETAAFCVSGDLLIYQEKARTIRGLDLHTGKRIWQTVIPSTLESNLIACGEFICGEIGGQRLVMLRPKDGTVAYNVPLFRSPAKAK